MRRPDGPNTPWIYEPDHLAIKSRVYHIILDRDDTKQFWRGHIGIPTYLLARLDLSQLTCHNGKTPVRTGDLSRKGGLVKYIYFGFSCDQLDDYSPWDYNVKYRSAPIWFEGKTYRTLEYVKNECHQMISQLQAQQRFFRRLFFAINDFFRPVV